MVDLLSSFGVFRGQGSTKVPARVHQRSTKVFQVSWCPLLWSWAAQSFCLKRFCWAAKSFCRKRFCGRFTKVIPWLHRSSTKVAPISRSVWFCFRADPFCGSNRLCGRFPNQFFKFVSQFLNILPVFPNNVSFEGLSHSKCLGGKMTRFSSWVLWSKWLSHPKRFFGVFAKQFFTFVSQEILRFFWQIPVASKRFCGGFAKYSLQLSPKWQLFQTSSLEDSANSALHLSPIQMLTCFTNTNPVCRKQSIMSLLLGY